MAILPTGRDADLSVPFELVVPPAGRCALASDEDGRFAFCAPMADALRAPPLPLAADRR